MKFMWWSVIHPLVSKGGAAKVKILSFVQLEISLLRIRVPCFSIKPYQAMRSGSFR